MIIIHRLLRTPETLWFRILGAIRSYLKWLQSL
jgi:hypothetical protein